MMQSDAFLQEIKDPEIEIKINEPMKNRTTFRIGGNADVWVGVGSTDALITVLQAAERHRVPVLALGRGSNLLVSDDGIEGAVVSLCGMNHIRVEENRIYCEAGATLSSLCIAARDAGLSGLEFAYGIPGSVGGAVFMNAGAYGGEMSQILKKVWCIFPDGTEKVLLAEELHFGYRDSVFRHNGAVITACEVELTLAEPQEIGKRMEELTLQRKTKQPLEFPSAGSTFKRPAGYYAGTLIDQNGLKGACVGGAQVSEKHAGFIINRGNATCKDVLELIKKVQKTVLENTGVTLEPEVLTVGRTLK